MGFRLLRSAASTMDEELEKFAQCRLEEDDPYAIVDARYEKVWEDG
jgi:transposase-like protein